MQPRRIVVLGAGAIGGPVAALLWASRPARPSAPPVVAIARGPHGRAIRDEGLRILRPHRDLRIPVPVTSLDALQSTQPLGPEDLVLLSVMGHHTRTAVDPLDPAVPIVSLQNGTHPLDVLGERGHPVIAGVVYVPAERLDPGVVALSGHPVPGTFLLGGWNPSGQTACAAMGDALATGLVAAGFRAACVEPIAPWVRAKLLGNLAGIVVALSDATDDDEGTGRLQAIVQAAQAEARAVFDAAGLSTRSPEELAERIGPLSIREVGGRPRVGGSTRHALRRRRADPDTTLETAVLHGPILDLAAKHGLNTPVNRALIALADQAATEGWEPGAMAPETLAEAVGITR